ncbi:hypothetical protein [Paraprevotella clara]
MKNHLPQNGFTGWIKTGTNVRERVERQEEKSVFSSIWRPESVVIRVSFCHDGRTGADGFPWGCGRLGMPDVRMKAGTATG